MSKNFLSFACLMIVSSTLHVKLNHADSFSAGQVNLKADTGAYLARCNNCGPNAYPDTASLHETNPDNPWAIWTVQQVGTQFAFKADSGKYLTRCNYCWKSGATQADSATVHVTSSSGNPWALWTPEDLGSGKWAFKGDNGKYLARCSNCATGTAYPNFAFVFGTSSSAPEAQWTVTFRFPTGRVSLKSDIGNYLTRCSGCSSRGASPDSASLTDTSVTARSTWTAERVGQKIAFKSDSGKYLSRCNNCWYGGAYPDSAFVHVDTPVGNPWAQWTPTPINGKWALQADTGNYLTRCNNCVPLGNTPNFAFVHITTPVGNPYAQWTVTPV